MTTFALLTRKWSERKRWRRRNSVWIRCSRWMCSWVLETASQKL